MLQKLPFILGLFPIEGLCTGHPDNWSSDKIYLLSALKLSSILKADNKDEDLITRQSPLLANQTQAEGWSQGSVLIRQIA